jgi:Contractile injection system tube protein
MERAAFLIESTRTRIGCLLNPSSVEIKRLSGVRRRSSAGGPLTGAGLSDDPLLYTGGGSTEVNLELLFDVTLAGSNVQANDVRDLTGPLWDLAENPAGDESNTPPVVRFIWGKHWNIPGVITAIAQRLEFFSEDGAPRRSWVRLRMLRASEPAVAEAKPVVPINPLELPEPTRLESTPPESSVQTIGGGPDSEVPVEEGPVGGQSGVRLDEIANKHYGDPAAWRLIALFNAVADPLRMAAGTVLRIPDITSGKTS